MTPTTIFWFAFGLWLCVVLMGCSFMAMGIELRWRSVSVKPWSFSFNARVRIQKGVEVITTYWRFKQERGEFPAFAWLMTVFGIGVVVIPAMWLAVILTRR